MKIPIEYDRRNSYVKYSPCEIVAELGHRQRLKAYHLCKLGGIFCRLPLEQGFSKAEARVF